MQYPPQEEPFRRSDVQFFHDSSTHEAIIRMADCPHLVVYCGAGVTIDRTGLGWGQLLATVFAPDASTHLNYPTAEDIELLGKNEDPRRLASILTRYSLDRDESVETLIEHLTPLLQNRLYKSTAWQRGLLAHNIAGLALSAATLGRTVDVVTTDYDTLLEAAFERELGRTRRALQAQATDLPVPQVVPVVYWQGENGTRAEDVTSISGSGDGARVNLHYLHGRVAPSGPANGTLIISEVDYAKTRVATINILRRLFQEESAVLILDASLTDPALIDALALTVPGGKFSENRRHILIPRTSLGYEKEPAEVNDRMVGHLARRCELLGLRLLAPDFRFQTAQFCEELQQAITAVPDAEVFFADANDIGYKLRLAAWWNTWSHSDVAEDPDRAHEILAQGLHLLQRHISVSSPKRYGVSSSGEKLRLELWVRDSPQEHRRLTMWASSMGPLRDPSVLGHADLEVNSTTASVRSFIEGRPQHWDQDELVERDYPIKRVTRWRSYFAVPMYVRIHDTRVLVGVLTIASTSDKRSSALPFPKTEHTTALMKQLIGLGSQLLNRSTTE